MNGKYVAGGIAGVLVIAGGVFFYTTQIDDTSKRGKVAAAPTAASAAPVVTGSRRYVVAESGAATMLIDAPDEKIKGKLSRYRGTLDVDTSDLKKTSGQIDLDLLTLKTETFGDPEKDGSQTSHALNWMEIGSDVAAKTRDEYQWARFTIKAIGDATPAKLGDAPEKDGVRVVKIVASGDMWLHGVTSAKTVKLTATFTGPPDAPTQVRVVSDEPIRVSLKEHDVKPRDIAGKFLAGSLEKIGKKIDDAVQITIDVTSRPGKSP